jgi:hypothetical protein
MSLRVIRLLIRRALYIMGYSNLSKIGLVIAMGSAKAQNSKAKPAIRVRVVQSNQSEGRNDKKGGKLAHPEPIEGT